MMWGMPEALIRMSLTGSYCILLILPVRFLLSGCGRKYAWCLWAAVFLNLVIPFGIQGSFSLLPRQMEMLPFAGQRMEPSREEGRTMAVFQYAGGAEGGFLPYRTEALQPEPGVVILRPSAERGIVRSFPVEEGSSRWTPAALWQRLPDILRIVWLPGLLMIVLYHAAYAMRIQRGLSRDCWKNWDEKRRIAEVEGLPGPFLWGLVRPVIFLPAGLEEEEKQCIIAHENCHRRRKDSVTKLAFFAAVSVHWFNPLVWLAWALFCRDLEICCDEAVFDVSGSTSRKQYAQSLLKYAAAQNGYQVSSLTFGEPSAGRRIRHILRFRKKHILLQSAAGLAAAVMILGLVVHPVSAGAAEKPKRPADLETGAVSEAGLSADTASSAGAEEGMLPAGAEAPVPETVWVPERRMGWRRPEAVHVIREDDPYFTPDLRPEEELEMLARTALRELYDLTGYQVESCVYECSDMGTFYFARTPEDLKHSRIFYARAFGAAQGYDPLIIPSMDYVSARRVWFSDVQQLALPEHAEEMNDEELAVWFLEHSAVYQGEQIDHTEPQPESWTQRLYTTAGTFYEVTLEGSFIGASGIYGPYPEEAVH